MHRIDLLICFALLCLLSVSHTQTLNCTNIPAVPTKPQDAEISLLLSQANDNIVVCNNIIPLLNPAIASLKLPGVKQQIIQTINFLNDLHVRIEIINRRLDCGLVVSVQEARNVQQMLANDQVSKRVLNGVLARLIEIGTRLLVIIATGQKGK